MRGIHSASPVRFGLLRPQNTEVEEALNTRHHNPFLRIQLAEEGVIRGLDKHGFDVEIQKGPQKDTVQIAVLGKEDPEDLLLKTKPVDIEDATGDKLAQELVNRLRKEIPGLGTRLATGFMSVNSLLLPMRRLVGFANEAARKNPVIIMPGNSSLIH